MYTECENCGEEFQKDMRDPPWFGPQYCSEECRNEDTIW